MNNSMPGTVCIRSGGHDGPCNGLPRRECEVIASLRRQRDQKVLSIDGVAELVKEIESLQTKNKDLQFLLTTSQKLVGDVLGTLKALLTTMPSVALDVVIAHARELVKGKDLE